MGTQRNVGTILAAALLLLLALPFAAWGVGLLNEVVVRGHAPGGSGGVFEALVGAGVGMLLIAAIHVAAAVLTLRGPSRRGSPAQSIALAGVVIGVAGLALALFGAPDVAGLPLLFVLAYGAVLVCLRSARSDSHARPGR